MTTNMAVANDGAKPLAAINAEVHFSPRIISTETIREALKKITDGENAVITPKEISALFRKNVSTVSKYLLGQVNMTLGQVFTLVHETMMRGDFTLADIIIPSMYTLGVSEYGDVNGSLDDEIGASVETIGRARERFNAGQLGKAALEIHQAKKYLTGMEKEIAARRIS